MKDDLLLRCIGAGIANEPAIGMPKWENWLPFLTFQECAKVLEYAYMYMYAQIKHELDKCVPSKCF